MNTLTHFLAQVPAPAAYALLAAAVLTESVLLVGAFIPTLTLLLSAGALARTGPLDLPLVIAAAAAAVVAGDALAYRTGCLLGSRLRTGRLGRRIPAAAWRRATALMSARGGQAVLICRFLPVIRTLAPHIAGVTALPYRRIAPYSATAALLWAGAEAGAGYAAAASIERLVMIGGTAIAITAATVVLAAVLGAVMRRRGPLAIPAALFGTKHQRAALTTGQGQGEQGLTGGGQASPPGADLTLPEPLRQMLQGAAGQIDRGRVHKHAKLLAARVILVASWSTRSFVVPYSPCLPTARHRAQVGRGSVTLRGYPQGASVVAQQGAEGIASDFLGAGLTHDGPLHLRHGPRLRTPAAAR